jgi:ABC-type transporter Mla subunit MlaD
VAQRSTKTGGRASGPGQQALERLNDSIEAAQAALKDLRSEMSRGSRELLKDVDTTLRDARKNVRSISRRVATDLDQVQQAARGKKPAGAPKTTTRSAPRKTTTRRSTTGRSAAKK